jgi:hypothetical protein
MTPNDVAKVNRRLKPSNMKIRRYGSGHALFDITGTHPEFMDFLSVPDMTLSTVEELAALCRLKDTRAPAQETPPVKKKGVAREKVPRDVRGVEIGIGDLVSYAIDSRLYCNHVVRITPAFVWMGCDPDKRNLTGNARREPNRVVVIEKAK